MKTVGTGLKRILAGWCAVLLLLAWAGMLQAQDRPAQEGTAEDGTAVSDERFAGLGKIWDPADFVFEEPCREDPQGQGVNGGDSAVDCTEPPKEDNNLPRVAIIIDDMGYHRQLGEDLLSLDLNLTYSFLPHGPFTSELETLAWQKGHDILIHMPMQPQDAQWDPGPGALHPEFTGQELSLAVKKNLAGVPHAIGANNHMGSMFTADRQAMNLFLDVLREQGLFFVDSVTTPDSVAAEEAGKMGIKTGSRHVFLDNIQTYEDICRQLKKLIAHARKHGSAIGIGHPNRATYLALTRCRDMLLQQVRIVGIHELVH